MNYTEYLDKLLYENTECSYCYNQVQTLHHKDENRGNNHESNLLPLCFGCHTKIKHIRSVTDYMKSDSNYNTLVTFKHKVTRQNRIASAKLLNIKPKQYDFHKILIQYRKITHPHECIKIIRCKLRLCKCGIKLLKRRRICNTCSRKNIFKSKLKYWHKNKDNCLSS